MVFTMGTPNPDETTDLITTIIENFTSDTTTTPAPCEGTECCFKGELNWQCGLIYASIAVGGVIVVLALIFGGCYCWKKRKSRSNVPVPPKPKPPDTNTVHVDNNGNRYQFDERGNKIYISDTEDSDSDEIPRPPAPIPRNNPAFDADDYPRTPPPPPKPAPSASSLGPKIPTPFRMPPPPPKPAPSVHSPGPKLPATAFRMPPVPLAKPGITRHINDDDLFDNVVPMSRGLSDFGLTYDDVGVEEDYGGDYEDMSRGRDYGDDYLVPHGSDKPEDYGGDYEDTNSEMQVTFNMHGKRKVGHSQQERPPLDLPHVQEMYEDVPLEHQMRKGVLDVNQIALKEYTEDGIYQNEPVLNPKAKASNRYKNLHMTRGEKIESEAPYLKRY